MGGLSASRTVMPLEIGSPMAGAIAVALLATAFLAPTLAADGSGSLEQFGCEAPLLVGAAPMDEVEEEVPDALDVVHQGAGELASTIFSSWACDRSVVDGEPVEDTAMAVILVEVDPPDRWKSDDVSIYYFPLALLSDAPEEAKRFDDWNIANAASGSVSLDQVGTTSEPAGAGVTAQGWSLAAHGPGFDASFQASHVSMFPGNGPLTVRYFGAQAEQVSNAVDFHITDPAYLSYYDANALRVSGTEAPTMTPSGLAFGYEWSSSELSHSWNRVNLPP